MPASNRRGTERRGAAAGRIAALLLLGGLSLGGATAAQATNTRDAVVCVQSLLAAAGQDAGAADGLIGPRTRQALAGWASARGLVRPPDLHPFNAAHWCRRLGLDVPGGRRFWPSRQGASDGTAGGRRWVDIAISPELPAGYDGHIATRLKMMYTLITGRLGVETAAIDTIVIASAPGMVKRMVTQRIGYPVRNLDAGIAKRCDTPADLGAAAMPGLAYVCIANAGLLDPVDPRRRLDFVLAHEAVHLVHFQVAGAAAAQPSAKPRNPTREPLWFIEGSAELIAFHITWHRDAAEMRRRLLDRYQTRPLPDLATLEDETARAGNLEDLYDTGALATALMVEARGLAAIGRLMVAVGEGQSFAAAYEDEFGEPLAAFYRDFAARARLGQAPDESQAPLPGRSRIRPGPPP